MTSKKAHRNRSAAGVSSPWTGKVDPRSVDATIRTISLFREALQNNPAEIRQVLTGRPDNLWLLWSLAMWDENQEIRARAIEMWEAFSPDGVSTNTVVEALHSPYPDVIVWATKSLINWGGVVVPSVAAVLHDPNRSLGVRSNAANVLSGTRGSQAFQQLIVALNDDSPTIRATAAMALGKRGEKKAVPALINLLNDPDALVCEVVIDTLGGLRHPDAIPPLVAILQDKNQDGRKRRLAINALGRIGGADAQSALLGALSDDDPAVRQAAAQAIGDAGDISCLPPLIERLGDPNPHVRATICRVVGRLGDSQALDPLTRVLATDGSQETRIAAAEALGSLGDPDALPALLGVAASAQPELQSAIRTALFALLGDSSSAPH